MSRIVPAARRVVGRSLRHPALRRPAMRVRVAQAQRSLPRSAQRVDDLEARMGTLVARLHDGLPPGAGVDAAVAASGTAHASAALVDRAVDAARASAAPTRELLDRTAADLDEVRREVEALRALVAPDADGAAQ